MLNQVVLVGQYLSLDDDVMEVRVSRKDGEDILSIIVSENISNQIEILKEGDLIGIRGRLIKIGGNQYVQCEKLTLITAKRK